MTVDELVVLHVGALNRFCDTMEKYGAPGIAVAPAEPVTISAPEAPATRPIKPAAKVAPPGPTIDDAMAIAKKLAALRGTAVVSKLVTSVHAAGKKVAELPVDKIPAFIAGVEVLLKQAEEEDAGVDEI